MFLTCCKYTVCQIIERSSFTKTFSRPVGVRDGFITKSINDKFFSLIKRFSCFMALPEAFGADRWLSRVPLFIQRSVQLDQMEFDSAFLQMHSLCANPSLVNKMVRARKATKNRFYRDDPGFVVLQVIFLVVLSVATGFTGFGLFDVWSIILLIFWNLVSYAFWSVLLSTITWIIANKWLLDNSYMGDLHSNVDWPFSFDIHCNGYFFYFIWAKVLSFICFPILTLPYFLARLLGNSILLVGVSGYCYITFLGYLELPMVVQQQKLLYPIPACMFFLLGATLFSNWSAIDYNFSALCY